MDILSILNHLVEQNAPSPHEYLPGKSPASAVPVDKRGEVFSDPFAKRSDSLVSMGSKLDLNSLKETDASFITANRCP
jgi:hypothetical protein